MKFNKICFTAAAVAAALMSTSSMATTSDIVYGGYIRGGVGLSGNNGQDVQFNKQQLGRLGNENDIYGEWLIGNELYNQDGVSFYTEYMLAAYSDGSQGWETTEAKENLGGKDDLKIALPQINIQASGLLKFAPEATIWAGKRYYQRHNVDLADFYYWNISGAGAGVEGINIGDGQLSVAWIRNDRDEVSDPGNNSGALNVNSLDVRYAGLKLWSDASLELGANYAFANESSDAPQAAKDAKDGMYLTAELTQVLSFGYNKTVLQYGTEGYGKTLASYGDGSWYGAEAKSGASAYRIINWGVVSAGSDWEIGHQLVLSSSIDDIEEGQTDDLAYLSAVVRPVYKWSDTFKSIIEIGYFDKTGTDGTKESGNKLTVAQAWAAGNSYWARPEIRVYASYLMDNENDDAFGIGNDSEYNIGVQAEVWW